MHACGLPSAQPHVQRDGRQLQRRGREEDSLEAMRRRVRHECLVQLRRDAAPAARGAAPATAGGAAGSPRALPPRGLPLWKVTSATKLLIPLGN